MDYDNIEQLVEHVNLNLANGSSIAQIERELELGKDTIRKRLNRANYRYIKDLKQFVLQDNTSITQNNTENVLQHNTDITQVQKLNNEKVLQGNTRVTQNKKKVITQHNTDVTQVFSEEEINILKGIIKNHKKLDIEGIEIKGKVVTRSFRTYETVVDTFVKYCNENKLIQKDAIAQAMIDFINNREGK